MQWMRSGMVSWEAAFPFAGPRAMAVIRECVRTTLVLALVVLLFYCVATAWSVLGQLGEVKLVDCRRALNLVSVRDVILCVLGYRIGTELVRAAIRFRRPQ